MIRGPEILFNLKPSINTLSLKESNLIHINIRQYFVAIAQMSF